MENKHYHIHIDPSAVARLTIHIEFLARVSEIAALALYDSYEEALSLLEETPEICPLYHSDVLTDVELRYRLFGKRYRIVFEISKNDVYIYDIQDCRQDKDKNLLL